MLGRHSCRPIPRAFLLAVPLSLVGCGTYASTRDAWPEPAFHGGIRFDLEAVSEGVRFPHMGPCTFGPYEVLFGTLDAPFSLAEVHTVPIPLENRVAISDRFDEPGVKEALRLVQAGKIEYPGFLRRILAAGVMSYAVFIAGRKTIYTGRRGEQHMELFP